MHRPRQLPSRCLPIVLLLAIACLAPLCALAQAPIRRIFGVGDDEFFKGAWMKVRPDSAGIDAATMDNDWQQVWQLADILGIDILRIQGHDFDNFDITNALVSGRTSWGTPRQRLILSNVSYRINSDTVFDHFYQASVGREIRFYPFTGLDSVEYKFWPAKFMTLAGGTTIESPIGEEVDVYGHRAREQHYKQGSLSDSTVIARDIVFDYFPTQPYRWWFDSVAHVAPTVQNAHEFLINEWNFNTKATSQFVVITGHLFDTVNSTQPNDTILKVEVIYEVPIASTWYSYDTMPVLLTALSNREMKLATFHVLKSQLYPVGSGTLNFDVYREAAFRFDARWCSDSTTNRRNTGPLFPGNPSRRINLKVTWIGNESVAIRSIALRDSIGQLVLGTSGDTIGQASFLDSALLYARRGATLTEDGVGTAVWPVIARSPIVETHPMHTAAFNRITRLVHDRDSAYDAANDTIGRIMVWNETGYNESLFQRFNEAANPKLLVPDAVVPEIEIKTCPWLNARLDLKHNRIPSIARHNGGRFQNPLLVIDTSAAGRDSIEYSYESTLQLLGLKQNIPYRGDPDLENRMHLAVGRAAEIARDTRRRMIIVPFCVARVCINYDDETGTPQHGVHSIAHIPEPAELRTMMNIGLCYGAKGVLWQVIDGHYAIMAPDHTAIDPVDSSVYWYSTFDDFGVHAPLARARNWDRFPSFDFYESVGKYGYESTTPRATITDFFTGWNIRSRALTDIHRWIDQVGPELMKLDWRAGYSIHFAASQPYDTSIQYRPLVGEIVRQVRTHKPGTATLDSLHRTFVELGIFYTKNSTGNPLMDTNHIFLVNRRCFERTEDISIASDTGMKMDRLAETRVINFHVNLPKRDSTQYNFLRITEVAGDTTRLPLASTPRIPLDTIIYADSAINITLGPGRAALLRITYAPPDQSIVNGQTAWNSQRKLIWDGNRHHTCYMRYDTTRNDTCIFYRRSLPVSDSTGAILWEPFEWNVSALPGDLDPDTVRTRNGYPSITMRTTGGDSVISIIWSCHPAQSGHSAEREIVVRDIGYFLQRTDTGGGPLYSAPYFSIIRHVDWYSGSDATAWLWGTPTIGSEKGGDFLIWSDSLAGIAGRVRSVSYGGLWPLYWQLSTNYVLSPAYSISGQLLAGAKYPSIPPFAKVTPGDSSCVVVWEHPYYAPYAMAPTNIMLERLVHSTSGGLPVLTGTATNNVVTASLGDHHHPSIDLDQTDGTGGRRQYGVAWMEILPTATLDSTVTRVNFKSLLDSAGTIYTTLPEARLSLGKSFPPRLYVFPNVSAMQRNDVVDSSRFAVVLHRYDPSGKSTAYMKQGRIAFRAPFFRTFYNYEWGGPHPAGSASRSNQVRRYAALYQDSTSTGQRLMRTSRQFFAKPRPRSYMAEGREVLFHLDDSARSVIRASLFDVWVAKDSTGAGLGLVGRSEARTDTLASAMEIMRTVDFHAHDSVTIGFESGGFFYGDSAVAGQARLGWVVELVDSTTGIVIHVLDSINITTTSPIMFTTRDTTLDLLSGTYFVRARVDTFAIQSTRLYDASRYPVAELAGFVEQAPLSKRARLAGEPTATARISAQPNPFGEGTEIFFSIPHSEFVSITLYDASGHVVDRPITPELMEAGRYVIPIVGNGLAPGAYLVELRYGLDRIVEKVVIVR